MRIWDPFIRAPVFAMMVAGVLVVFGLYSYRDLGVDLIPRIDFPFVVVQTVYPGASPEEIETSITKKVEDAVATVEGLKHITSYSLEGVSIVALEFELEVNSAVAAQDVRDRIATILSSLPEDARVPEVVKFNPTEQPIMEMALEAPKRTEVELRTIAEDDVKPLLESIPGVGRVDIAGGKKREFAVELDAERLIAHHIPYLAVVNSLMMADVELPTGSMKTGTLDYTLRFRGRLDDPRLLGQTAISASGSSGLRISDLGRVVDTYEDVTSQAFLGPRATVSISVVKRPDAHIVQVADAVRHFAESGRKNVLPDDLSMAIIRDASDFIRESLDDVRKNVYEGAILATLVILLFLRNFRSTVIIVIAIPTSLVSAFILMRMNGYTINFMTLLSLATASGMVVDDAIVVLENIYRHLTMGKEPRQAAADGISQVWLAITASTFTTVAVFGPISYMKGIMGRFFREFGLTVAFAILASLIVSITISPALASTILKKPQAKSADHTEEKGWFASKLRPAYQKSLRVCTHRPGFVFFVAVLIFLTIIPAFALVRKSFLPPADTGEFSVLLKMPVGTRIERTSEVALHLETKLRSLPEVKYVLAQVGGSLAGGAFFSGQSGSHIASFTAVLKDRHERDRSVFDIVKQVESDIVPIFREAQEVRVTAVQRSGPSEAPISLELRGPDRARVEDAARQVRAVLETIPGLKNVSDNLPEGKPEYQLIPDRDLMRARGITPALLARTLRGLVFGETPITVREHNKEIDVRVRLQPEDRSDITKFADMVVLNDLGQPVLLREIGTFRMVAGPTSVIRMERLPSYAVTADIQPEVPFGEADARVKRALKEHHLPPPGISIGYGRQEELFREMFENFFFALMMGSILVFLVLASQFNSLVQPFIIMTTIPLGIVGAIWLLVLTGRDFTITSVIAILMLSGVTVKQSILMVDFINQMLAEGRSLEDAIFEGCGVRLRPILMTQFTTIIGLVPTVFGVGGAASWKVALGTAFIGGMLSATFLTLYVIPAVYALYYRLKVRFGLVPANSTP
ncbi:MAG: efflux RND transporter permease subunit [bacterium JZ-2024 1]